MSLDARPTAAGAFDIRIRVRDIGRGIADTAATFARADLRSLRILVAEDNGVNQIVVRGVLRKLGAAVDVVSDGRQAVEVAKRGEYDLILMDVRMPEMDGLEATHALRADPATAGIPIAALSADALSARSPRRARFCRRRQVDGQPGRPAATPPGIGAVALVRR